MVAEQALTQKERVEQLRHLTKTDPDPRVRRRAHGVLLAEQAQSLAQVARFFGTAPHRVRAWQERFLRAGRAGMADQARGGRPPKLNEVALALPARSAGTRATSLRLPRDGLDAVRFADAAPTGAGGAGQCSHSLSGGAYAGLPLSAAAPRSDPRPKRRSRGDRSPTAGMAPKKRLLSPDDSIWSMWTNVKSTPIRTWRKSGGRKDGSGRYWHTTMNGTARVPTSRICPAVRLAIAVAGTYTTLRPSA